MREFTFENERKDWRRDAGPWDNEPDKRIWTDGATGFPCLIVRHPYLGHLCGYVGVPRGHPWFSRPYNKCDIKVHGGLTYADTREDENTWWFGFDCNHAFDDNPYNGNTTHYRDITYVTAECHMLAVQIYTINYPREVTSHLTT